MTWTWTWRGLRHQTGNAIFLWLLLFDNTTWRLGDEWGVVAAGVSISDEELAFRLGVSAATARRYRLTLVKAGLLRCGSTGHTSPMWLRGWWPPEKSEEQRFLTGIAESAKWAH